MADQQRPEVTLEINSGFFRIPTKEMVYNITVIAERGGIPIVEKIVEVEKRVEAADSGDGTDPYFRQVGQKTLAGLAGLSRGFIDLAEGLAGGTGQAAEPGKIKEARTALAGLKDAAASASGLTVAGTSAAQQIGGDFAELVDKLRQAREKIGSDGSAASAEAVVEETEESETAAASTVKRYLFDLDVIFQTLYELCTNETVKSHIVTARENRETYFDKPLFLDKMNEKIAGLEADADNFFNVPMSDVLISLEETCNEKPIKNLLKKMDSNLGSIFLDSILPLEVPEAEEVQAAAEAEAEAGDAEARDAEAGPTEESGGLDSGQLEEVGGLLDEAMQLVDAMAGEVAGGEDGGNTDAGSESSGEDLAGQIDKVDALLESALTTGEGGEAQMPEVASFQRRLLEAVVTLHEEIRLKEENGSLTAEGARQQATAEAARRTAGAESRQDVERILDELGL